jgi:hypothetical protein
MKSLTYPAFAALVLTGCVSGTSSWKLPESHPANPQASQSPEPIAVPTLLAGSQGLVLPVSTNQTDLEHGHHHQTPAGKGAQKPAEHKHEHEQPKKEEKK